MAFTTKDLNDIVSDILINIVNNVDEVTDVNVGAVLRQIVESIAIELESVYGNLSSIYDGTRIDTATGDDLDQIGKIVGIARKLGIKSLGDVTFKRNTPAISDFSIAAGLIVSTQPNTGDEQLRFVTSSPTTFYSSIAGESHLFVEGIYDYRLDERFVGNSSSVAINGTVSSSPYTFTINTDFGIVGDFDDFLVDVSTIEVLDRCEALDWTETDDADVATLSVVRKEGSYSLNLGKSGTSSLMATYYKTLVSTVAGANKDLVLYLYFDSASVINKIDYIYVWAGSSGSISNSYRFKIAGRTLVEGFALYRLQIGDASTTRFGIPALNSINHLQIQIVTKNSTDTITLGDIKMDFWNFSDTSDFEGDVVRFTDAGTKPDSETDFEVDYTPLSKEVQCVAEDIGAKYNVNKKKIIYQVSNIANINSISNYENMSGGSDKELDDDLRERIIYATELKGKATSESIRQAILAVEGVTSATVEDLPSRSVSSEVHLYSSGTSVYKLDNEVLSLDSVTSPSNIIIAGTVLGSPNTFIYGTDYTARFDSYGAITSEIEWLALGTKPDDGTTFTADYSFDWLGHVTAFVSGEEAPLPASVLTDVNSAIEESKAAGIVVTVVEPTAILIPVTADITVDSVAGYTFSSIEQDIEDAIYNFINGLGVGENVYIAKLYEVIMGVAGVKNASISSPASDVTINTDEIAKPGTITLSEI